MFETVPRGDFSAARQNSLERRMSVKRRREKGGDLHWGFLAKMERKLFLVKWTLPHTWLMDKLCKKNISIPRQTQLCSALTETYGNISV